MKGRDWFDFVWYVDRIVKPNFDLLGSAIDQTGPWAGKGVDVTPRWYLENLALVVKSIDWRVARKDVERFLFARHRESVKLWNDDFFMFQLKKLGRLFSPV